MNVNQLLIEGGKTTAKSFLDQKLVDETLFFIAPKLIGNRAKMRQAKTLAGPDLVLRELAR